MRQIKCFIASAFGYSDIDAIYENAITQVLAETGISAHRVDREIHNDDIDDKIIELINTCDICIADLTYARPSVYYEAGYFSGLGKQVIFMVRSDHFQPKESDVYGVKRVHFDLQMKNIISWYSITQTNTFQKALKSRINHICEPILKRIGVEDERRKKNEHFKRLSPLAKKNELFQMKGRVFKSDSWKVLQPEISTYLQPVNYYVAKRGKRIVATFITQSATKKFLKFISNDRIVDQNHKELGTVTECHLVIISLRKVPPSRIEDLYPDYELVDNEIATYKGQEIENIYVKFKLKPYIHVLSGLLNLDEYRNRLFRIVRR
jgi:nucleoside 2-deoxyribosyltransferase